MREAVGLFSNMEQLQNALKELERTDFPRDSLSILGNHQHIEEKFGNAALPAELAEDDGDAPREAPVRSEEKTIGAGVLVGGAAYIGAMAAALSAGAVTVPAIIAAAALGGAGGATIGGILAKILGDHYDAAIEEQIQEGGLLLWVRTPDVEKEERACQILSQFGASHVRIHDI